VKKKDSSGEVPGGGRQAADLNRIQELLSRSVNARIKPRLQDQSRVTRAISMALRDSTPRIECFCIPDVEETWLFLAQADPSMLQELGYLQTILHKLLPDGRMVAVIHAGVRPGATWRDVCDWESDWIDVTLDYELRHNEYAIWGRHHSVAAIQATHELPNRSLWEKLKIHEGLQPLVDVDLLVSGHTPLPGRKPLLGANRLFIDTGGYHKDGWLTLVDPLNCRAWRAPNALISDQHGVEEIEWPVLISAEPFQLTPEQIREAKLEDLRHRQKLAKALDYFPPTDVA